MVPDLSSVRDLSIPVLLSLFVDVLDKCQAHPHINTGKLLEHWRNSQNETLLSRLASWDIPLDEDNQEEIFLDSLDKIIAQCVEKQIENLHILKQEVSVYQPKRKGSC